jgi:hypothetical protein
VVPKGGRSLRVKPKKGGYVPQFFAPSRSGQPTLVSAATGVDRLRRVLPLSRYDLVALAMQEPQYANHTIRVLMKIAEPNLPCLSIMNILHEFGG